MTPAAGSHLREAVAGLPAYVAGRAAASPLAAPLASNENHFSPLPGVLAAVAGGAVRMNRYPDMATTTLRTRLAGEWGVGVDEIAVGPGSVGVLSQVIQAVCDAGDEVVFAWRSFEAYPILCRIAGAVPVAVPLADENHDLAAMLAAITDRTRVVLLCSPNNPTGTSISTEALNWFLDQVPAHVVVVLDEAYREFVPGGAPDTVTVYRNRANLCLARTFSKAYGLAGLRVGYAIAHPELAEGLRRVQLPFSVSSVAELAAVASLDAGDELLSRVAQIGAERDRMLTAVRDLGWTLPDSAANFLWLRLDDERRTALVDAFDAADVMVRGYPGDGVRITIGDARANDRVLAVLAARTELANPPA